ncbi:hypothetical protein [Rosistilla oblonga]|uniref:hypothetical protein n=1 Tax=Rosistilla oblonga TaxID=2527990 RepID=UPI003A97C8F4
MIVLRLVTLRCLIVAVVACMATSESAWASCGDWLANPLPSHSRGLALGGSDPIQNTLTFTVRDAANHSPGHGSLLSDRSPLRPCDCRGPQCQAAPGLPSFPTAPAPTSERDSQQLGIDAAYLLPGMIDASSLTAMSSLRPCDGFSLGIQRPPRG